MSEKNKNKKAVATVRETSFAGYDRILLDVVALLESARRASARAVNAVMTATYWEIGRRIVEHEQVGTARAAYGEKLLEMLATDLTVKFGRGFSRQNLQNMRLFYQLYPPEPICQTPSGKSTTEKNQFCQTVSGQLSAGRKVQTLSGQSAEEPAQIRQTLSGESGDASQKPANYATPSREFSEDTPPILQTPSEISGAEPNQFRQTPSSESSIAVISARFPLPWSHYVHLLSVENPEARKFYEIEALRGGWSVRQLDRQISTLFFERTLLSRNKAAMLKKGVVPKPEDAVTPEEEIKDPLVLEFLGLKDEYSESELEEALIHELERFLLELGGDFAFVGRQRRLRIDDEWYRVDLLFFHRRLRCLVVIDLKVGKFTHADAGQMHMYLNYAREHWTGEGENPPVGLILCTQKKEAVAHYSLEGLPNKVLAAQYKMTLPDVKTLAAEIERTRKLLERRAKAP